MTAPAFQLGQIVWYASASACGQVEVPCPVCFGKLEVQLVLGNGETQGIACNACERGFGGPTGAFHERAATSYIKSGPITGMSMRAGKMRYEVENWGCEDIYATEAEAEERRVELHAKAGKEAAAVTEHILSQQKKGLTWSVSYHQSCIRDQERRIQYHYEKLRLSREKELAKKVKKTSS